MRHPFDAVLEGVARAGSPVSPAPRTRTAPFADLAPAAGVHSLWEFAAAWTPEADPPPSAAAPPSAPRPSASPGDVAAELGLAGLRTVADVARARRRFMWDNHPDRRTDLDHDLANRRVAIANMLLDGALVALRRHRRA